MKQLALRVHEINGTIESRLEEVPLPSPGSGEVLIRVQYSSINYKDALAVTGAGRILRRYPLTAGVDLAGIVEDSQDSHHAVGDAVLVTGCGLSEVMDGGYAHFASVPADAVIAMPPGMDALQAMTLGTAGFTAALAVHRMEENGQTPALGEIMVTGATGGVGSVAIDILTQAGYAATAVSSKADQDDYLRSLGAQRIVRRQELHLSSSPLERAQFGGAIDNVGGELLSWLIRSMHPRGNVASIGLAAGSELHTSLMPFLLRGVALLGINSSATQRPLRERIWQRLSSDLRPRHLDLIRTRTIELAELQQAMPDYLKGRIHGRTVVHIQD